MIIISYFILQKPQVELLQVARTESVGIVVFIRVNIFVSFESVGDLGEALRINAIRAQ